MFARLARNKVTQCHAIKSRVNQALARPNASVMTGNMPMRMSSAMQLSGLQLNNKMFITSSVLEKQVSIMKNENIPKQLKASDEYVYRHMGNSKGSTSVILETLGVKSVEELMDQVVPASIRLTPETRFKHNGMELEGIDSEMIMLERMRQLSESNIINKSFIGQGYYGTNTPSVIRRNVLENPRWYTPYTPYQAEIAQGRLESLLNFQTAIMEITEMDVSNASLLDEATAAAEAVQMSYNFHNGKRNKYFVSNSLFPQTIAVIKTKCHAIGIELEIGDTASFNFENAKEYSGMIVQTPDNFGSVHDYTDLGVKIKESGLIFTIVSDILGNCIMKTPGAQGADIACGSAQRMGIPMAYGGPHPGYFASCDKLKRKLPGRIIGISKDAHGNQAFRMALQTREQHIRRDKATSNICTAQALLANMAAFYMQWHGQYGLKKMAIKARFMSQIFMQELSKIGIEFETDKNNYFDTVCINVKESGFTSPDWLLAQFHKYGINIRKVDGNRVSLSFDEITSLYDLD
jgi:glycine dehydrogenase